jgi:redox-sensitive bicupin YhaK (pirin superfamily)
MPEGDPDGCMYGFQLWANLPRANKMMAPRYQDVKSEMIPVVNLEGGVTVRVICGEVAGVRGPVENIVIDPQYLDITVPAKTRFTFPTPLGHTVIAYIFEGKTIFCEEQDPFAYEREGRNYFDTQDDPWLGNHSLVVFEDGEQILVSTEDYAVRFLLVSGRPIREPVAWYGPIVMNTETELRQAFDELQKGTFIKRE